MMGSGNKTNSTVKGYCIFLEPIVIFTRGNSEKGDAMVRGLYIISRMWFSKEAFLKTIIIDICLRLIICQTIYGDDL